MRLKNEIFLHVLDWLHTNKKVRDQAHLAEIIGIDVTSMSRIMNGKSNPSEKTLRKLNEAFGNIFNMNYLRGKDPYHMLAIDLAEDIQSKKEPDRCSSPTKGLAPVGFPDGTQNQSEKDIIDLATSLIVELEHLRRQTQQELALLVQARQSFESATAQLQKLLASHNHDYFPNLAAEYSQPISPNQ
jgi:transcriptional regulator with XRE-family HTH domain